MKKKVEKYVKRTVAMLMSLMLVSGAFTETIPALSITAQAASGDSAILWLDDEAKRPQAVDTEVTVDGITFKHPGIYVDLEDLNTMQEMVAAGYDPWLTAFENFRKDSGGSRNYTIKNNGDKILFGQSGHTEVTDAHAAYLQTILWYITGDTVYLDKAIAIIRVWYETALENRTVWEEYDQYQWSADMIRGGQAINKMCFVAEILRATAPMSGWTEEDTAQFTEYLDLVVGMYDRMDKFMNQTGFANLAMLSSAIFQNDAAMYREAMERFTINGNAQWPWCDLSLANQTRLVTEYWDGEGNYIVLDEEDYQVQLVEMGRDQPHANCDVNILAQVAQIAHVQGMLLTETGDIVTEIQDNEDGTYTYYYDDYERDYRQDVYGAIALDENGVAKETLVQARVRAEGDVTDYYNYLDERLIQAINYSAKYNMGQEVKWYPVRYEYGGLGHGMSLEDKQAGKGWDEGSAVYESVSTNGRGRMNGISAIYYHYRYENDETRGNVPVRNYTEEDENFRYIALMHEVNGVEVPHRDFIADMELLAAPAILAQGQTPQGPPAVNSPSGGESAVQILEAENYTTLRDVKIDDSTVLETDICEREEAGVTYLHQKAGTTAVYYKCSTTPTVLSIRYRSEEDTTLEFRSNIGNDGYTDAFCNVYLTVELLDTGGQWRNAEINLKEAGANLTDIQYITANGTVDIDKYSYQPENVAPKVSNYNVTQKILSATGEDTLVTDYVVKGMDYQVALEIADADSNEHTISITGLDNVQINGTTYSWQASNTGEYTYLIRLSDGVNLVPLTRKVKVFDTVDALIAEVTAEYESELRYSQDTLAKYENALEKVEELKADYGKTDAAGTAAATAMTELLTTVNELYCLDRYIVVGDGGFPGGIGDKKVLDLAALTTIKDGNGADGLERYYVWTDALNTFTDIRNNGSGAGGYMQFDFGQGFGATISEVYMLARQDNYASRIQHTVVQGSNDLLEWTDITVGAQNTSAWQQVNVTNTEAYRYIRVYNATNWYGNMAELRLIGQCVEIRLDQEALQAYADLEAKIAEAKVITLGDYDMVAYFDLQEMIQEAELIVEGMSASGSTVLNKLQELTEAIENLPLATNKIAINKVQISCSNNNQGFNAEKAGIGVLFDDDITTFIDVRNTVEGTNGWGGYVIFDLGEGSSVTLNNVAMAARNDNYCTRLAGAVIQGSNNGTDWTTLTAGALGQLGWQNVAVTDSTNAYRYLKLYNGGQWFGNIAELKVYGTLTITDGASAAYTTLESKIAEAKAVTIGEYNLDSFMAFQELIGEAEEMLEQKTSAANMVLEMAEQLTTAMSSLPTVTNLIDLSGVQVTLSNQKTAEETGLTNIFDGNIDTMVDVRNVTDSGTSGAGGYIIFDLGETSQCIVDKVAMVARNDNYCTRLAGTVIQGSNNGTDWTTLTAGALGQLGWQKVAVTDSTNAYRYLKLYNSGNWFGNIAELRVYGSKQTNVAPTTQPTAAPTTQPTTAPTTQPTAAPTTQPTAAPTTQPTTAPTTQPTIAPTTQPTTAPTTQPTIAPTTQPTTAPTTQPTAAPTTQPTSVPTTQPTTAPTTQPTSAPTTQPTTAPTTQPTAVPTTQPTSVPTTQPTTVPTTAPTTAPTEQPTAPVTDGWNVVDGMKYWYEDGVLQGTEGRGKEIYDPETNAWYWLDSVLGGAVAKNKDVYQESEAGPWADRADGTGKWVRYDENGYMIKGWQETEAGNYYFDTVFGTMAKGYATIEGIEYYFDEATGVLVTEIGQVPENGWKVMDGMSYWYEGSARQGFKVDDTYRGKEIYDAESDAWYWLDNVLGGAKAVSKDVYQESYSAYPDREDGTGKWVRYDENGRMIKGWQYTDAGTYYFEEITGSMAKGRVTIEGQEYYFDEGTGILQ